MKHRFAALSALTFVAACAEAPTSPALDLDLAPAFSVTAQVYTSGSHVDTWNAIVPPSPQDPSWLTTICVPQPAVGLSANWVSPHKAFVANGASFQQSIANIFTASWINAWPGYEWYGLTSQYGGPPGDRQQSWTRYSTPVSGTGTFDLYLAADNCSWIYITDADGINDGVQDGADAFPLSNLSATCTIRGCNSGVAHKTLSNGATCNDLIGAAYAAANGNHGAFVSAVTKLADGWKKAGLISGRDQGAITSCAARSK